jgi:DNA-binding transcriptional MerR regulator
MERLRVGELARLSGVGRRTIDYYTVQGLLEPSERSDGGHRFYTVEALYRIRAIKSLQSDGLSLEQIRGRLAERESAADVLAHAEQLRAQLLHVEEEAAALGEQIVALPPGSKERTAAERALRASMLCALSLAQKVATLLMEMPPPVG